jgi:hypothetical protein
VSNRYKLGLKCRDCGAYRYASRQELGRSARVRCLRCGGPMELSGAGGEKMADSQDVVNEQRLRFERLREGHEFWQGQTAQEGMMTAQDKLRAEHGTPEEFQNATWEEYYDCKITADEAVAAITRYRRAWTTAGDTANQDTLCADHHDQGSGSDRADDHSTQES